MSTPAVVRLATTAVDVTSTQVREACKNINCDFEATCELGPDDYPRCSCKFDCASISQENMRPVCGSDLRTYSSLCAMKMEACQRQQELRPRPLDLCQGSQKLEQLRSIRRFIIRLRCIPIPFSFLSVEKILIISFPCILRYVDTKVTFNFGLTLGRDD